ncbi:hypothetical protein BWK58_15040, partial [Flavobacterium columnare]
FHADNWGRKSWLCFSQKYSCFLRIKRCGCIGLILHDVGLAGIPLSKPLKSNLSLLFLTKIKTPSIKN